MIVIFHLSPRVIAQKNHKNVLLLLIFVSKFLRHSIKNQKLFINNLLLFLDHSMFFYVEFYFIDFYTFLKTFSNPSLRITKF